ncbi:MAG: 50S ribosomal protein L25 [Candidatus Omnitrophota bacterium]
MKEIILNAKERIELGSAGAKKIRRAGYVPAVVYGEKKEPYAVKVEQAELVRMLRSHKGENVIIRLKVAREKGEPTSETVMIREMQHDPVSEKIIHIDFNRVSLTHTVSVKVPVESKGDPVGVKVDGGALEHLLWEIDIECLPQNMPKSIDIDVSGLKIGDAVHIKDISFAAGIKVKNDPDAVILSVAPPAKEEPKPEEAIEEADGTSEPEVIKEKKKEPTEELKEGRGDKKEAA